MKKLFYLVLTLAIGFAAATVVLSVRSCNLIDPDRPVTDHNIIVEKVVGMGKMELVQYQFQDLVAHEIIKDWWPDPKVLLFVKGEAVGCVDFTKIDSAAITHVGDSVLILRLPQPEICYTRIDHDSSKVFDTQYTFWEEAEMVEEAYKQAEKEILHAALKGQIIENAKKQAELVLKPTLEALTGREIHLQFPVMEPREGND